MHACSYRIFIATTHSACNTIISEYCEERYGATIDKGVRDLTSKCGEERMMHTKAANNLALTRNKKKEPFNKVELVNLILNTLQ